MADKAQTVMCLNQDSLHTLEDAIALLENGQAQADICVDLGDGIRARANGSDGLKGLLQRLRAYKMLLSIAGGDTAESVVAMQPRKPELHPEVAIILDALREQS